MIETELSFLVEKLPEDLEKMKSEKIIQGYFSNSPSPLRIRRKGERFELTKKFPISQDDLSRQEEVTIPLEEEEFECLFPRVTRSLEKIRYYYPLSVGLTAEIDVFQGFLAGLVMVEVEFKNKKQLDQFLPPKWFGRNITQEQWSANAYLAGKTFEEIKRFL
jgi:CYTH domain-containing protein